MNLHRFLFALPLLCAFSPLHADTPRSFSGIYPHLSYFNDENECGTGGVVPWADRLWIITYGPHLPMGSSDKLYEITPDLDIITRPESVGGTHANRMIHEASQQLLMGPYLIDQERKVRVLPPVKMPGRITGTSQHLTEPDHKVYYATMEEGLYEVDVNTLEIKELIEDGNGNKGKSVDHPSHLASKLPGYHGKGLYTAQNRVIYANNGDRDKRVVSDPTTPSGALAEWFGEGDWKLVRRNQFTEVTGPDGIHPKKPTNSPVWSLGWDHRSLILMCLEEEQWHSYRLPKGSHSYDGAHGWNTEWPRIRDIGESSLLMTMHGNFWSFPKEFSSKNSAGIRPRSAYLKVIGDFARWNDRVVFGCDDSAKSEFLNKRPAKGEIVGSKFSHSNLWFLDPKEIDHLGPVIGTGSLWVDDHVQAYQLSDPMLFGGYHHRGLILSHQSNDNVKFHIEVDELGHGEWKKLSEVVVPEQKAVWVSFSPETKGAWIRLRPSHEAEHVTATFVGKNPDRRTTLPHPMFNGLATRDSKSTEAYLYAGGNDSPTLKILVKSVPQGGGTQDVIYELPANLKFSKIEDSQQAAKLHADLAVPKDVLLHEASSILLVDGQGRRFRFPKSPNYQHEIESVPARICREVCTERDLFHAGGLFYELPAENADGFRQIRPIASHPFKITDYTSWRGLLVLSGIDPENQTNQEHIVRSEDGHCAVWLGAVDDLWKLGKPVGEGGPWLNTQVKANEASDAYLMHGFDKKTLILTHQNSDSVLIEVQVNLGTDTWLNFKQITVQPGEVHTYEFPVGFNAKWIRFIAKSDCTVSAQLKYE